MVAWSSVAFRNTAKINLTRNVIISSKDVVNKNGLNFTQKRFGGHHREPFHIKPSDYVWKKFKDVANFYLLLGAIPIIGIGLYTNIFIGDAELAEIPEGYEPKPWEYHKHPITRFLAKYVFPSPQEVFERNLHDIFATSEKTAIHMLELKINELMKNRLDYQSWYFIKPSVQYPRKQYESIVEREREHAGFLHGSVVDD